MTEIWVLMPFLVVEERIQSTAQIRELMRRLQPNMEIQNVYWSNIDQNNNMSESKTNNCFLQLNSPSLHYSTAVQNASILTRLQTTITNMKQDLRELIKAYQNLKHQNLKLINKLQKYPSNSIKNLSQSNQIIPNLQSHPNNTKQLHNQQPLSLSLQLNTKNIPEQEKSLISQHKSNSSNILQNPKSVINSLEKQIATLTQHNLQLENTVLFYQTRLQFVGDCLRKQSEDKEKEKKQAKPIKKDKK